MKISAPALFVRGNLAVHIASFEESHWITREKDVGSETGWETSFDTRIHVLDVEEANHFTIIKPPHTRQVSDAIVAFAKMAL